METLIIAATKESPGINFDVDNKKFLIFGKSYPEEAKKFFDPVFIWLEEYAKNPLKETIVEIRLDYYNSATATMILELFYTLEKINENGHSIKIIWNYLEIDDDMLEAGKEYQEMIRIPFEFKPINDSE